MEQAESRCSCCIQWYINHSPLLAPQDIGQFVQYYATDMWDTDDDSNHSIMSVVPVELFLPLLVLLWGISLWCHQFCCFSRPTDAMAVTNMYKSRTRHYHNILLLDGCIPHIWRDLFWVHVITIFLANLMPCQSVVINRAIASMSYPWHCIHSYSYIRTVVRSCSIVIILDWAVYSHDSVSYQVQPTIGSTRFGLLPIYVVVYKDHHLTICQWCGRLAI